MRRIVFRLLVDWPAWLLFPGRTNKQCLAAVFARSRPRPWRVLVFFRRRPCPTHHPFWCHYFLRTTLPRVAAVDNPLTPPAPHYHNLSLALPPHLPGPSLPQLLCLPHYLRQSPASFLASNLPLLVLRATQHATPISVAPLHGYIVWSSHHETGEVALSRSWSATNARVPFRRSSSIRSMLCPLIQCLVKK